MRFKRTPKQIDELVKRLCKDPDKSVTFMLRVMGRFKVNGYRKKDGSRVVYVDRFNEKRQRGIRANVFYSDGVTPVGAVEFVNRNFSTSARNEALIRSLLEHPECAGSPNGGGMVTFEVHDPEGRQIETRRFQKKTLEARNAVDSLSGVELILVAAHFKSLSKSADDMAAHLDNIASSNPMGLLEAMTKEGKNWKLSNGYLYAAAVSVGLSRGLLSKQSEMAPYEFEGVNLGSTYQAVVEKVSSDAAIFDRLVGAIR